MFLRILLLLALIQIISSLVYSLLGGTYTPQVRVPTGSSDPSKPQPAVGLRGEIKLHLSKLSLEADERRVGDGQPKCSSPPWNSSRAYALPEDSRKFFRRFGSLDCMVVGTDEKLVANSSICPCRAGWYGDACSIPESVWISDYPWKHRRWPLPIINKPPRRIIQAFPFNIEFEMLDARMDELKDVVDVFLILESNYTAYGDPRPLRLLERLKAGDYPETTCRIIHVLLDYFPTEAHADGWIADSLTRNYITQHALGRQLTNYSHEDMFLLHDADELPTWESVLFLKLHDGYPIPVGFHLRPSVYGFFWTKPGSLNIFAGMTMGFLIHVFQNKCIQIRSYTRSVQQQATNLNMYLKSHNRTSFDVRPWSIGNSSHPAGWHCSWCGTPDAIRNKLVSAQNGDFPRWGDFPEKRNLTYIRGLVGKGMWFDNKSMFKPSMTKYAPSYILENFYKYKHLLVNLYELDQN